MSIAAATAQHSEETFPASWPIILAFPSIAPRPSMPAPHRPALTHAPLRVGGRVRGIGCDGSPLRDLATQLAFKVTGSPAVLSQAVRDPARG